MTMRVAIDFKVMGTEAANRGMGRFTQQQVFEALRADPSLEVFLILQDPLLPERCVHDWTNMPRVHPVWLDREGGEAVAPGKHPFERKLLYGHRMQSLLRRLRVDLLHDATPFIHEPYTALTRTPVVATCYDLIPLIFPKDYFQPPIERSSYLGQLRNLRVAARVGAISHSAAWDLRCYTGYPADRIDITYPFIETAFRLDAVGADRRARARAALRASLPSLPERFLLSVTGIHRSKNLGFLLDSYALARRRPGWNGLPLVVVLPATWALATAAAQFGAPEDVVFIAQVEEEELRDLYLAAEFVFQPSMYEGFGYPVAEAMSCGAAVIATSTASIPEITGDAALLLDPTDREAGADAILRLATDATARDALRAAAQSQVAQFRDPARLGESTLACWRAAAAGAEPRPRIALWSSMPPLDCGIADYTAELADAMAATHDVDVYTDGTYAPSPRAAPNVHFRHPKDFDPSEPGLADSVFQLQVREYQAFLLPALIEHGGTVMLHDMSIGGGLYVLERKFDRLAEFEDRILAPEGPDAVRAFGRALSGSGGAVDWARMREVLKRHPLLRWAVAPPNRVLTFTENLRRDVLHHYPDADARVVRQGYGDRVPLTRHLPLPAWRNRLGLGTSGLVVGVFGIVGPNKRVEQVIAGFEPLWREHPDSLLVIVGACYDAAYAEALRARIAASPARERIHFGDYAPPSIFHALIALSDVMVTLRWPPLGGLSAVLLRGLAAGKPMIVSDIPDWRGVGGAASLPVPAPDDENPAAEAKGIAAHLLRLAADPAERGRLGRIARDWYHREATLRAMAADHAGGARPSAPTPDTQP